jgi:hypothetical protein
MPDIHDKVMIALELTSQAVPMEREGWASTFEVNKFKTEAGLTIGTPLSGALHDLVTMGRAESKVVRDRGQATTMFRPFRGGAPGAGGDALALPRQSGYDPGASPRGGRSTEDYGDTTTVGGGGVGVPLPVGDIVRSVM